MAAIRSKDTKPEVALRRGLHARGFRFRLHVRDIPGTPDIVLPRYNAIIDVRSCFFHGHDCDLFKLPSERAEFWEEKIASNRARDARNTSVQSERGWRVAIVWECSLRGRNRIGIDGVVDILEAWIRSSSHSIEVRGQ